MSDYVHILNMGGYALYVWPAYGLVLLALVTHLIALRRQRLRTFKKLKQWFKRVA